MSGKRFYLALQYSAIQKTILRHDRLWSIAGISHGLAELNEVTLPGIIHNTYKGTVLVAGGGKCTAVFDDNDEGAVDRAENRAEAARRAIEKVIATTFPMLEFQLAAEPAKASDFQQAWNEKLKKDIDDQKQRFRGYGVSYNPHLVLCPECGEYPVQKDVTKEGKEIGKRLCAVCRNAQSDAWSLAGPRAGSYLGATIERIYRKYLSGTKMNIPINFEDLSAWRRKDNEDKKPRMAVWFSDLNNMNSKVPLWLRQGDDAIKTTFNKVKDFNIELVSETLTATFKGLTEKQYLPFRLVVAGGDDLCIAMDEPFILFFCRNYAKNVDDKILALPDEHPLSVNWLKRKNAELCNSDKEWGAKHKPEDNPTPYCFGGSFVVTSTHTPFRRIHEVGEDLMGKAKRDTNRAGNSVNWTIMAVEKDPLTEGRLAFDKPLLIGKQKKDEDSTKLSFEDYNTIIKDYRKLISGSQRQRMIDAMIKAGKNDAAVEDWMIQNAARETDKLYGKLLMDKRFKVEGKFKAAPLATLLELLGIEERPQTEAKNDERQKTLFADGDTSR